MKKVFYTVVCVLLIAIMFCSVSCSLPIESNNDDKNDSVSPKDNEQNVSIDLTGVDVLKASSLYKVSAKNSPMLKYSFRDDNYYYYLFDLGMINNVPLGDFSGLIEYENHGQEISRTFTTSTASEETITRAVSSTTQSSVTTSTSQNVKIASEEGIKDVCKVSAEYSFSVSISGSLGYSYTNSYANASKKSTSEKTEQTIKLAGKCDEGLYGYALTGAIEVYAIVVFNPETKEYTVDYFSDIKQSWQGFYYFKSSDEFVNYNYEKISFTVPSDLEKPENYKSFEEVTYKPIVSIMTKYNCADNNQYNKDYPAGEADDRTRHNGYDLGELLIYGCEQNGNYFTIGDSDSFSLKFHVLQTVDNLPRVNTILTKLNYDTSNSVRGTNINGTIGYGAYWVRITYSDDSQTQINATNQFQNATPNTYVEFLRSSDLDSSKKVSKIEVIVVYELYATGIGPFSWMGKNWQECSNWRCEFEYDFIY